jgi:hypothetical protein
MGRLEANFSAEMAKDPGYNEMAYGLLAEMPTRSTFRRFVNCSRDSRVSYSSRTSSIRGKDFDSREGLLALGPLRNRVFADHADLAVEA